MFSENILLPLNAKYLTIGDFTREYNPHWDIIWSITYALTGDEHAFCTYLTDNIPLSATPGHCVGYLNEYTQPNGFLAIAFDTTGYFAMSSQGISGVSYINKKENSLIVRNYNKIIYNKSLSSIDPEFNFTEEEKIYKTLRFRVSNGLTNLCVDYRTTGPYKNLIKIPLSGYSVNDFDKIYPMLSYTSPVSSNISSNSTIFLKNFNIQGREESPTYEVLDFTPLTSNQVIDSNTLPIKRR